MGLLGLSPAEIESMPLTMLNAAVRTRLRSLGAKV